MESALVIASAGKDSAVFAELLRAYPDIVYASSCGCARRLLLKRDFHIVIISAPLPDESGENLARQIALSEVSQVILAVRSEMYEQVSAVCEGDGVLTIAKPIDKEIFRQALGLAKAVHTRLKRVQSENESLKQKIDNIRIAARAKNILQGSRGMSEHEAHRYIEKKAMDTRSSKRAVSEGIIHEYENGA